MFNKVNQPCRVSDPMISTTEGPLVKVPLLGWSNSVGPVFLREGIYICPVAGSTPLGVERLRLFCRLSMRAQVKAQSAKIPNETPTPTPIAVLSSCKEHCSLLAWVLVVPVADTMDPLVVDGSSPLAVTFASAARPKITSPSSSTKGASPLEHLVALLCSLW